MADPGPAIAVAHLSKTYRVPSLLPWRPGSRTEALRDVSFQCPMGKITCLLGPNGSGKTTIIKILAGLVEADGGEAIVAGTSLRTANGPAASPPRAARGTAAIGLAASGERSFYWRLTGRQNLDFFASLHGLRGATRAGRVAAALGLAGLEERADTPVRMYSTGMLQKLILARALLGESGILLLDEPTTHLDHGARVSVHRLIREELLGRRAMSVLLCTNDLREAEDLADSLVLLQRGVVLAEGPLETLRGGLGNRLELVMSFDLLPGPGWGEGLGITIRREQEDTLTCAIPARALVPDIVAAAVRGGGRMTGCACREPSLSDVFEAMTGDRP
jgi:ABC-2 type transport system ATP-binding protein